jgi:hypothetical protein
MHSPGRLRWFQGTLPCTITVTAASCWLAKSREQRGLVRSTHRLGKEVGRPLLALGSDCPLVAYRTEALPHGVTGVER